ncbi:MAG: hypothetical protein CL916_08485 [Deltaproteobacteria bacterium]|nr:hypothetical protein [Deltaproteobacteria bacterium]
MQNNRYGTWSGVFVPTIISILGVIMYLRQGWVVGNAGLLGAWFVILLSIGIALCTALSLSSIATNTRLHAGGAYAIISRSLGLEAGASIGVALYLAQTLAITMYLFGFREGYQFVFGMQDPLIIDLATFIVIFGIALYSTKWASRVQYVVLVITILSLFCMGFGPWRDNPNPIQWYGEFSSVGGGYRGFWATFAVFFPAVTGIMAGANMSGELIDPRKNIPKGTIFAVLISAVIYLWLAWVLVQMAPMNELQSNNYILVEQSAWSWLVELAILCAISSLALVTMVGAPRILQALAKDGLIPFSGFLRVQNKKGEPQNAVLFTGGLVLISLLFRDLNALAPVITICFLTTYAAVNGVVLIEQGMGLISFRPRLRLSLWIPALGSFGALFAMLIINPSLSIVALGLMLLSYALMTKRGVDAQGDVRGNLFVALAQWVAREAVELPRAEARAWVPHPMIVTHDGDWYESLRLLAIDLAAPHGSIKLLNVGEGMEKVHELQGMIRKQKLFCSCTSISSEDHNMGLVTAIEVLKGAFFRPNILFVNTKDTSQGLDQIVSSARDANMGMILTSVSSIEITSNSVINVWVRAQEPHWEIEVAQQEGNLDLALLLALQLAHRHQLSIRLLTMIAEPAHYSLAEEYLHDIITLGRMPKLTKIHVSKDEFWIALRNTPSASIQIFGFPNTDIVPFIKKVEEKSPSTNLFVRSSGIESILL